MSATSDLATAGRVWLTEPVGVVPRLDEPGANACADTHARTRREDLR